MSAPSHLPCTNENINPQLTIALEGPPGKSRTRAFFQSAMSYIPGRQFCSVLGKKAFNLAQGVVLASATLTSSMGQASQSGPTDSEAEHEIVASAGKQTLSMEEEIEELTKKFSQLSLSPPLPHPPINNICDLPGGELACIFSQAMRSNPQTSAATLGSVCRQWHAVKTGYLPLLKAESTLHDVQKISQNTQAKALLQSWGIQLPSSVDDFKTATALYNEIKTLVQFLRNKFSESVCSEFGSPNKIMREPAELQRFLRLAYDRNVVSLFTYAAADLDFELNTVMDSSLAITETAQSIKDFLRAHGDRITNIGRGHCDYSLTALPKEIGLCRNLSMLDIPANSLILIPDELKECRNLRSLNISENHIAYLPNIFENMPRLRTLSCSFNFLEQIPPSCAKLEELQTLSIEGNALGSGPEWLSQLKQLTSLSVDPEVDVPSLKKPEGVIRKPTSLVELRALRQRYPLASKLKAIV